MHIAALFTEFAVIAPAAFPWLAAQWQSFATSAGSALIGSIWQGAAIVCVLEIATRLMPRASGAQRFAMWAAGFLLSLALPFLPLVAIGGSSSAPALSHSGFGTTSPHALFQIDERWGFAIAGSWLLASIFRASRLFVQSLRLRRLWKSAQSVEIDTSLSSSLASTRSGRVAVCASRLLDRPSVIGFFAPRILIPDWLLTKLTAGELEQIVLHEAEHLHRLDDWTNLFQKLCLVIFPLNPALAWIEHHLCREREIACDEGVIRITNAPRAYAACLASLAERRLERRAEALSLGAWHRRSELVHRVHRILVHKRAMSRTAAGALLATFGSALFAGSVEMSRFPQLVAFVPSHSTTAMTRARQVQLDALLARENADAKVSLPPSYSALPAKAILPYARHNTSGGPGKRVASKRPTDRPIVNPTPSSEQIAKADVSGDRVLSPEPQAQQWVVVAAWEEVSTVSRVPRTISDFESTGGSTTNLAGRETDQNPKTPPSNAAIAGSGDASTVPTPDHHFTVTQLILRIVPASPKPGSTQPAAVPVRDGWFVIQL
jgi:beta-lactamase regulating signal transducer with metallopeptidase domain